MVKLQKSHLSQNDRKKANHRSPNPTKVQMLWSTFLTTTNCSSGGKHIGNGLGGRSHDGNGMMGNRNGNRSLGSTGGVMNSGLGYNGSLSGLSNDHGSCNFGSKRCGIAGNRGRNINLGGNFRNQFSNDGIRLRMLVIVMENANTCGGGIHIVSLRHNGKVFIDMEHVFRSSINNRGTKRLFQLVYFQVINRVVNKLCKAEEAYAEQEKDLLGHHFWSCDSLSLW